MQAGVRLGADEEFVREAAVFRGELLALCYRMLGSLHDAEDAVQEAYIRAWRGHERFDGRSTLRTWLYRITTRVCLRALEQAGRRPLPSGLAGPAADPEGSIGPASHEVPWLQPFPTASDRDDPATIAEGRTSMRLALVAALQVLPPRQRAVLILRDVLEWRAAEVASLLDATPVAVNSLLQRARSQLAGLAETDDIGPLDAAGHVLVERYAAAFERADVAGLVQVLTEDAVWEMPPIPTWFSGREVVGRFLATRLPGPGGSRLVHTEANGQPAVAVYQADRHGRHRAHALQVLTVTGSGISRIVAFLGAEPVTAFGMPEVW